MFALAHCWNDATAAFLWLTGPDGGKIHFDVEPFRKHCLMNGLDDIGLTMEKAKSIDSFESKVSAERPWL